MQTTYPVTNTLSTWTLQGMPGFPWEKYTEQNSAYAELYKWYSGSVLDEGDIRKAGQPVIERYPLKLNPLKGTCRKHASVLFGSNIDSIMLHGVPIRFSPERPKETDETDVEPDKEGEFAGPRPKTPEEKKAEKDHARIINALSATYEGSGAAALFVSNAITSQWAGGCVFMAKWLPQEARIEISTPSPIELIAIPFGTNWFRLKEAWVVRGIKADDLASYSLAAELPKNLGQYYYVEHWTESEFEIVINGVDVLDESGKPFSGTNPFGFVPIVYIPHLRETGKFLGDSIITDTVKGVVREINARWADMGDAVSDDAHQLIGMRNVRGNPNAIQLDGRTVINLGSMSGMGVGESPPDLFAVKTNSTSDPMLKLGDELTSIYRREVDHPAVADGEDEGSQRSSLTLTTRMWPLVSHAEMERIFWSIGLKKFNKMLLSIMSLKNINDIGPSDVEIPITIEWLTMLPRDRDALINEIAVRDSTQTAAKRSLMKLAGDTKDTERELRLIAEETELLAKKAQPPEIDPNAQVGNAPAKQDPNAQNARPTGGSGVKEDG